MLKFNNDCDGLILLDGHDGAAGADRCVMYQSCQPVMIQRTASDPPWAFLSGYDFTEGHDEVPEWLPGGA